MGICLIETIFVGIAIVEVEGVGLSDGVDRPRPNPGDVWPEETSLSLELAIPVIPVEVVVKEDPTALGFIVRGGVC